jgi:CDGSH-type Zn-finger protein
MSFKSKFKKWYSSIKAISSHNKIKINLVKNGPLIISIDKPTNSTKIQFTKSDKTIELDTVIEKAAFCTCGKSTQYPFCDGSHKSK